MCVCACVCWEVNVLLITAYCIFLLCDSLAVDCIDVLELLFKQSGLGWRYINYDFYFFIFAVVVLFFFFFCIHLGSNIFSLHLLLSLLFH